MKTLLLLLLTMACAAAQSTLVSWSFNDSNGLSDFDPFYLESTDLQAINTFGVLANPFLTSFPSDYPAASASVNYGNPVKVGAFDLESSTYLTFAITSSISESLILDFIQFGSRSTATGPQAFSVRWSQDNFESHLIQGSLTPDSTWRLQIQSLHQLAISSSMPTIFRLYLYGGQGTPISGVINHRLDDFVVGFTTRPIPEPSLAELFLIGCLTFLLTIVRSGRCNRQTNRCIAK